MAEAASRLAHDSVTKTLLRGASQLVSVAARPDHGIRPLDSRLGRDVALKVLPPKVTDDPSRLERFDREARAIADLNHRHIVTL